MGRVIQYVSQPKKTMDEEGNRYLTGVNCVADVAMQSFMATKHLYGKDTGSFTNCATSSHERTPVFLLWMFGVYTGFVFHCVIEKSIYYFMHAVYLDLFV